MPHPSYWFNRPLIRSALLVLLFLITTSQPWAEFAGAPYIPLRLAIPFLNHLFRFYILRDPSEDPRTLAIFLDGPELRNLAVPPNLGGPQNQMVFVTSGYAVLSTIILIAIPLTFVHYIAITLSVSSTIGFIVSMMTLEKLSLTDIQIAPLAHTVLSIVALLIMISFP
jgi:hypothetical protein